MMHVSRSGIDRNLNTSPLRLQALSTGPASLLKNRTDGLWATRGVLGVCRSQRLMADLFFTRSA